MAVTQVSDSEFYRSLGRDIQRAFDKEKEDRPESLSMTTMIYALIDMEDRKNKAGKQ